MATLTPYSLQAETHVNGHRLSETNYNAQRPQQQSNAAPLRNVNSRSVPALHEQQLQPVGGPSACQTDIQQQMYYPSQQQTAEPTSPTQTTAAQHQTTRSRSVQNLSEQSPVERAPISKHCPLPAAAATTGTTRDETSVRPAATAAEVIVESGQSHSPSGRRSATHLRHPSVVVQQQSSESPPLSIHSLLLGQQQQTGSPWEREKKEREVAGDER